VLDEDGWKEFLACYRAAFADELREEPVSEINPSAWQKTRESLQSSGDPVVYFAPRGIGPTAWDASEKKQVQHQRRFYLLGQTLDGMRAWDVVRAIRAIRSLAPEVSVAVEAEGATGGVCLYAALFEEHIGTLRLQDLPKTHRDGPYLLNVQRILDLPQTVAMVAGHARVTLVQPDDSGWDYPREVAKRLGWDASQLQIIQKN
jgi:hypothetical protein